MCNFKWGFREENFRISGLSECQKQDSATEVPMVQEDLKNRVAVCQGEDLGGVLKVNIRVGVPLEGYNLLLGTFALLSV